MPEIKVTTFNVEWMVNLFKTNKPDLLTRHNPRSPGLGGKPKDPRGVARRIAGVIRDVDPDILGICEGPPLHSQMATFTRELLDGDYEVFSMEDGQQSVHTLVHKRVRGLQVEQLPRTDRVFERLKVYRALRPLVVGVVHGLAGSAAVVLLVLAAIREPAWAVAYLAVFGLGTVAGMVALTTLVAAPFVYSSRYFVTVNRRARLATGLLSLGFGLVMAYRIGTGTDW